MNGILFSGTLWKRERKDWKTCLVPAVLAALLNATAAHGQTVTNVSDFGFDSSDSTVYLQAAIDSGADKVVVDNIGFTWYSKPLVLRNDLDLVIESGVVLQAKPGGFPNTSDRFLTATTCTNLIIRGPGLLVMNKAEYTSGEWRHAINLLSCNTVTITNLTILQTGGDGIYIGDSIGDASGACKNIVITDCVVNGAMRNGISVISAENLRVSGCTLKNTAGKSPESGIDFEPNHPYQSLSNCLVENCTMQYNDDRGFLLAAIKGDGTTPPYDITVTNCTMSYSGNGISLVKSADPANTVEGLIRFIDCQVQNTRAAGIEFRYFYNTGLQATFDTCLIANSGITQPERSPLQLTFSIGVTNPVGGIAFTNTIVTDLDAPALMSLAPSGESDVEALDGMITYNGEVIEMNAYADFLNNTGLIGYWTLDDADVNGTSVLDSAYGDNDGTTVGFSDTSLVTGQYGEALVFDGSDHRIVIADATATVYDSTFAAFTAMAWIKPDAASGENFVMGKMGGSIDRGWQFSVDQGSGEIKLVYFNSASGTQDSVVASGLTIPANEWMHIAATFLGSTSLSIYTNGVLAVSETTGVLALLNSDNAIDLEIGGRGSTPASQFWDGCIDDVRIYAEALTEAEIASVAGLGPVWLVDMSIVPGGTLVKAILDAPDTASRYFPMATTNLVDGLWINVAHSDDGTGFEITNLNYSATDVSGSNRVIYLQVTESEKFFKIERQ